MLRRKESSLSKIVEQVEKPGVLGNLGHTVLRVVFDIIYFFLSFLVRMIIVEVYVFV